MSAYWWISHLLMLVGLIVVSWLIFCGIYMLLWHTVGKRMRSRKWQRSREIKLHEAMAWDDGFKAGTNWQWHKLNNRPEDDPPENPFMYPGIHDDMIGKGRS